MFTTYFGRRCKANGQRFSCFQTNPISPSTTILVPQLECEAREDVSGIRRVHRRIGLENDCVFD